MPVAVIVIEIALAAIFSSLTGEVSESELRSYSGPGFLALPAAARSHRDGDRSAPSLAARVGYPEWAELPAL